jgi:hypothetical protein
MLLLIALQFRRQSSRDLALGFAGFRQDLVDTQQHALFWLTNQTSSELWWFHHVSLKIGDNWKQDGGMYQQLLFLEYIGPPESRNVIRLVAVPVSNTNVPLRVVFECLEQIPIRDKLEEFYQQRFRNRSVYVANGRHYFVTNEVPLNVPLEPRGRPFLRSTGAGIQKIGLRPAVAVGTSSPVINPR